MTGTASESTDENTDEKAEGTAGPAARVRAAGEAVDGADPLPSAEQVEQLLDLLCAWFRHRFRPERAVGRSGTFRHEVVTPLGVRHRYLSVVNGHCAAFVAGQESDVTVGVELRDLVALATGESRADEVFVAGRLKFTGDVFFAMNWFEWFGFQDRRFPDRRNG
ncbi:SCP2 sterol-binding domain-containing protein [Streptomyces sp. NPDC048172]|uniref:SCP2 sterol-binding domain-containing protein n=1 Tax=Streptomyces sp. NPDC048172 TaxID=3365505 RepID=UPI00371D5119